MPEQNIWVYLNRRTNPATIHRFTSDGQPSAVAIRVMKQADTDGGDTTRVETVCLTGAGNTACLAHLPADWETNGVPRGTLYVGENEYPDPHGVFAKVATKREADVSAANPPAVEENVGEVAVSVALPQFDPADLDQDGQVTKAERKEYKRQREQG